MGSEKGDVHKVPTPSSSESSENDDGQKVPTEARCSEPDSESQSETAAQEEKSSGSNQIWKWLTGVGVTLLLGGTSVWWYRRIVPDADGVDHSFLRTLKSKWSAMTQRQKVIATLSSAFS